MKKTVITCDCCGEELTELNVYSADFYVHVLPGFNRMKGHAKSINGNLYSISGRKESRDFCIPCYNDLFSIFFAEFKKRQINLTCV